MTYGKAQNIFRALPWWGWLALAGLAGFLYWWIFKRAGASATNYQLSATDTGTTSWSGTPGFSTPTNN